MTLSQFSGWKSTIWNNHLDDKIFKQHIWHGLHATTAPRGAFFEGFHRQGAGSTIKPRRGLSGRWGCPTQFLKQEEVMGPEASKACPKTHIPPTLTWNVKLYPPQKQAIFGVPS